MSKKDQKKTNHTWGHFTLASFAGTKSVVSSPILKIKVNAHACAKKTYHSINNINSECSYIAPMIFSASSPRMNPATAGTGVTVDHCRFLGRLDSEKLGISNIIFGISLHCGSTGMLASWGWTHVNIIWSKEKNYYYQLDDAAHLFKFFKCACLRACLIWLRRLRFTERFLGFPIFVSLLNFKFWMVN